MTQRSTLPRALFGRIRFVLVNVAVVYGMFRWILVPLSGTEFRSLDEATAFSAVILFLYLGYLDLRRWLLGTQAEHLAGDPR